MKRKPDACKGCPLYEDGYGYVADKLDPEAEVLVVSMFPTTYESRSGVNRSGWAVEEYEEKYEKYAGGIHKSYAHLIRCRAQRGTRLPKGRALKDGAAYCRQYDDIGENIELIVYNGIDVGKTLREDIGRTKIQKWRGFIYPDKEKS